MDTLDRLYEEYQKKGDQWDHPICQFIFLRTYARLKNDGTKESFSDVCYRCVKNIFNVFLEKNDLNDIQETPSEMFQLMIEKKFCVAGRSLFASTEKNIKKIGGLPLYNCCCLSINSYLHDPAMFFYKLQDRLMLGLGVGFDALPKEEILLYDPKEEEETYIVPDDRESWCLSVYKLLNSYFKGDKTIKFEYHLIREKGIRLSFGGVSSGYQVLETAHNRIRELLKDNLAQSDKFGAKRVKPKLTSRIVIDVAGVISAMVISGAKQFNGFN